MKRLAGPILYGCVAALCLHALSGEALAADASWRPVYDLVMRWINFLILAFLLVKFGRKPLMNFLKGQRFDLAREIDELKEQKTTAEARLKEIQGELEQSNARFVELTERIIRDGERRKEELIEEARLESQIMLESAQQKIASRFIRARQRLRSEIVDSAIDKALERLPALVNDADNERLIQDYIEKALAR